MADFDATLMKEIFDIPQRKWKTNVEHHGQADDLGAGFEVLESVAFCHPVMLGVPLAHFNQVSSDSAAS
jgi:hypothetical protein